MILKRIMKLLFGNGRSRAAQSGEPNNGSGIGVTVSVRAGTTTLGAAPEYAAYCEERRRDPAARVWRKMRDAYLPKFAVSTDPVCPYCGDSFGKRKPPSRRSKFSCKQCGNVVFADPWHRIFPSVYLNARQGLIARYLGILDKGVGTAGKTEDFWWAAQQKDWLSGKERLTDAEAADALWTLMNYNVEHMLEILPPEERESYPFHANQLQQLMQRFRQEEKKANRAVKAGKTPSLGKSGPGGGKLALICPYCDSSLGEVAQPSRRSRRKCKKCSRTICVDPKQKLFRTPFLTEKRQFLADALAQLDHWVFTKGRMSDFNRVRKAQGKSGRLTDNEVAEVLRALIAENVRWVRAQAEKEYRSYKQATSEIDKELRDAGIELPSLSSGPDETLPKMVEDLLTGFDGTVSSFQDSAKQDCQ